jgi:translation initiation factor IF-2
MLTELSGEVLYLVIKADTAGMEEAILNSIEALDIGDVAVEVVYSGTGDISKNDMLMAETSGKLLFGFNVDLLPGIREIASEKSIEIRLHNVIYRLLDDVRKIAMTMAHHDAEEKIKAKARVIALFPGARKGIILGCEVYEGELTLGSKFRIISEPGPVYFGTVNSLHIETRPVNKATVGQQVGLKISGFKEARIGDIVISYDEIHHKSKRWYPSGTVYDLR